MKLINKLLKPLNLTVQKRDRLVKDTLNSIVLLELKLFVANNYHVYGDTILGKMIKEA